jgi:hypothetical protein
MDFALWLERKWQQLSPEFEIQARKLAQEIEGNKFRLGQRVGLLPVQSIGKSQRNVPLIVEKCPLGIEAFYNTSRDAILLDPSALDKGVWYIAKLITHEGIHAFDPKTKINPLIQQYASKVSTTAKPGTPEYSQLPEEFEAIGGELEYSLKTIISDSRISVPEKLKYLDDLKNWLRLGVVSSNWMPKNIDASGWMYLKPQAFINHIIPKSWKNNQKLWRLLKEKLFATLERIRGNLTQGLNYV